MGGLVAGASLAGFFDVTKNENHGLNAEYLFYPYSNNFFSAPSLSSEILFHFLKKYSLKKTQLNFF